MIIMAIVDQLTSSENPELTIIPLTIEYVTSVYGLMTENSDFLSKLGDPTGTKYESLYHFSESITDPDDPRKESYVILSRGVVAGSISLRPVNESGSVLEMGYWIGGERFAGQGLASESARIVSDHALYRNAVEEVVAFTHPKNMYSKKTLLRSGFLYLGIVGVGNEERLRFAKSD
jgi:RimJ/RimL family protein N-acetyltransferase